MSFLELCEVRAKQLKPIVVFADAFDSRVLEAAQIIKRKQIGIPILLGAPISLRNFAEECKISTKGLRITSPTHDPDFNRHVKILFQQKKDKGLTKSEAEKLLRNPLYYSTLMVKNGSADLCIAGNISSTTDVLRAGLQIIGTAENTNTVSSFYIMQSPDEGHIYAFGDCSVIPRPTAEQLMDIAIRTACNFTRITGQEARVAMLSFSTNGSAKHEMADKIKQAVIMLKERKPSFNLVESEIQFDAAIIPEIGKRKFPESEGKAGKANVLIFPSLNAGNIGYKIAERMGGYTALGPFIQGLNRPIQDLSRGCTVQDIVKTFTAVTALI